jgi:beta-galactosidase GanA
MTHLMELVKNYEAVKREDLDTRAILVLEMIRVTLAYPPVEPLTKKDISKVDEYVQQLVKDLRKNKQYLFAVRISKTWEKREHLLQLAKNWHEIKNDFMDEIEYHEEIKWLRDEGERLTMKQNKK